MTDHKLVQALWAAAEALLGRHLTTQEQSRLIALFNAAPGTTEQRARRALAGLTGLDETTIHRRSATSDDVDRIMQELANVAKQWRPSS